MRFRLIPRDESFYPLFDQLAQIAADTAVALTAAMGSLPVSADGRAVLSSPPRSRPTVCCARFARSLEHAIVTPFDREDIQALSNALDDVVDEMRAAADSAFQHNIVHAAAGHR